MLDWLIIGGGIHGTLLSIYLTRHLKVPTDRLRVVDPSLEPLALWKQLTVNVGMDFLRSPHVHNLHYDPFALMTFARSWTGEARFIPTYNRPSLALFHAHSQDMIERYRLMDLRIQGRVRALEPIRGGWCATAEGGELQARQVILAFGVTEQPRIPGWATDLRQRFAHAPLVHVFEPGFASHESGFSECIVVGGGITAAQTALKLARRLPGRVRLLSRHPIRVHPFDSDTCWVVASCVERFHQEPDLDKRRHMIRQARHKGSMPTDVAEALQLAQRDGRLRCVQGDIQALNYQDGRFTVDLADEVLQSEQIVLATGFEEHRPGGLWLDQLVQNYALPVASDGFPVTGPMLDWAPGLFVSGALAELTIGPTARNIIGARLAAYRIGEATKREIRGIG